MATHDKMFETQITQVSQQEAATASSTGIFSSHPQPNPKGHTNAITLQSRTELDDPVDPRETVEKEQLYVPPPPYKSPIPYPQRLSKSKIEGQFKKFVELFKQLHIASSFIEAIIQMPSYAKFLKEIIYNNRKLDDNSNMALTEECSAIIQNNMTEKLKDPGSFSIPCVIGKYVIDNALFYLGPSVSLIPLLVCERLNLGDLKPSKLSLQLVDCSVKYPVGIMEDILVRIAMICAIIDVKRGKLIFEVGEEKIELIFS
ncbi:uncharacterized protein LOC127102842 [Lathyrus oleraceus]|uniref:uncharacterized protein LOC127102842 n=1 Tax=Pisum sativum TaxID=3888 RepID=UPI0021D16047|nr:uncharacterized protein LOC127102842 [Pisum sativum]